jgi:hypothetical protein
MSHALPYKVDWLLKMQRMENYSKKNLRTKNLKKYWSITKIIAGRLNAFAIILIAI